MLSRDEIAAELHDRGLRVTSSRIAVYDAVSDLDGHPSVQEISGRVRHQVGSVSVQAVYDGLRTLTLAGLLRRIEPAGGPARFETRVADNHHHVVCRACGRARDVDCLRGAAPCLDPDDVGGFAVDEAEITFWGLCPDCQRLQTPLTPGTGRASAAESPEPTTSGGQR